MCRQLDLYRRIPVVTAMFAVVLLLTNVFVACGDDDDDEDAIAADDDAATDDDTADDDTADDDTGDDDSADDDTGDDDTGDDDTGDDDTGDDDTGDDDTGDDDTADDDTGDDDCDDDSGDDDLGEGVYDPSSCVNPETIVLPIPTFSNPDLVFEFVAGGASTTAYGVPSVAVVAPEDAYVAASFGGWLTVDRVDTTGVSREVLDMEAGKPKIVADQTGRIHGVYTRGASGGSLSGILMYLTNAEGSWTATPIDCGNETYFYDIAIDREDRPHVVFTYSGGGIRAARPHDGTWEVQQVATGDWDDISIAVHGSDNIHVLASSEWPGYGSLGIVSVLQSFTRNAGVWTSTIVDIGFAYEFFKDYSGERLQSTGAAFDSSGKPIAAYTRELIDGYVGFFWLNEHAIIWNPSATPSTQDIASWWDGGPAMAATVDRNGSLHVSYPKDNVGLAYVTNTTGAWIEELPGGDGGSDSAIDLDVCGRPHIVHRKRSDYSIHHARRNQGQWTNTVIEDRDRISFRPAIYQDRQGATRLFFRSLKEDAFVSAVKVGGAWMRERLFNDASVESSADPIVRVNSADQTHVLFSRGKLRYIYFDGSTWIENGIPGMPDSENCEFDIDVFDRPTVFCELVSSNYDPRFAVHENGTWNIVSIPIPEPDAVDYGGLALALDSSGIAHVVFSMLADEDPTFGFAYGTNDGGNWNTAKIADTYSTNKERGALLLDANGDLHYFVGARTSGGTPAVLLHLENETGIWVGSSIYELLETGATLSNVYARIGPGGFHHIVFEEKTGAGRATKYATNMSGKWTVATLSRAHGTGSGFVLGANGMIQLSNGVSTTAIVLTYPLGYSDNP